ncbi:hypothetical protein [Celeribacter sp.]|uniref:hypothetical protein n=1 Tax=Celeribacter sp. TaxID=1890673 RepID=UPI003A95DD8C
MGKTATASAPLRPIARDRIPACMWVALALIAMFSTHPLTACAEHAWAARAQPLATRFARPLAAPQADTSLISPVAPLMEGPSVNQPPMEASLGVREGVPFLTPHNSANSLFAGRESGSFFAPLPPRVSGARIQHVAPSRLGPVTGLRDIIGRAESRRDGYDAVNHGAKVKPPRRPTEMTISDIYNWIDATPGQPHAIGRFQFIPKTLRRLVAILGVPHSAQFSPELQDYLADQLLREAGIMAMQAGQITRRDFMINLAKIWAGLPTPSGKSHYHGFAGNKATITWAEFDREMARLFPT